MAAWKKFILLSALTIVQAISTLVTVTENGGYKQVVVAISPEFEKHELETLLPDLQALFIQASRFLHTATRNHTFFQEIIILLPKTLQNAVLPDAKVPVMERKHLGSPDIFIVGETMFGNTPFTIQNSGCGEPGLYIKVPASFVSPKQDREKKLDLSSRAKVIVHEWAHYRYGVFDEHGFFGDKLYPLLHSIPGQRSKPNVQLSACTDKKVPFVLRNYSGDRCPEFSEGCLPVIENREDVQSSLMYDPSLPKVSQFCDGEVFDHDRDSPTKQNSLCREESTWNVISRNADLKVKRDVERMGNDIVPLFKYVVEPKPKIVFLVEGTEDMGINDKMDQVRNAFSYFVLYDLPADSWVGLVSMKSTSLSEAKPLFLELTSNAVRERLCDAFPDSYGGKNICVHCGIRRALEVFNSDKKPKISGTLVIVTTVDISSSWVETITQELTKEDVKLFVIYFHNENNTIPLLENLAVASGGRLYMIPEKLGSVSFHSPLTVLYETFRSIYGSLSWTYKNDALVTQKVFYNSSSDNSLSFSIDESITSFRLILTVPNFVSAFPVVKDEVILQCEYSEFRAGDASFSYKSKIPAYIFTIENPQNGSCRFKFQRKPGFTKYLAVIIRALQQDQKGIKVRSWFKPLDDTGKLPGILYTEVLKGAQPILNANVTALVLHPNLNRVSELNLFDAGEGDPDITRNDGIYSRYLTDFSSEGYYTLAVLVRYSTNQDLEKRLGDLEVNTSISDSYLRCCGSSIPVENGSLYDDFIREHIFGSFYVKMNKTNDRYAPRRIVDLMVINTRLLENGIKHFTLQWTAPGDDYDYGTAQAYEIKVFKSRDDALDRFESGQVLTVDEWKIHGPWLQPDAAGTVQTTIIQLSGIPTGIYYLAMRAVDSAGNYADVSNVVKVYHDEIPPVGLSTATSQVIDPDKLLTTEISESTTDAGDHAAKTSNLNLIIGITCCLLFLMIIIAFALFIYLSRHRKLQEKENTGASTLRLEENTNASNDTLCRSVSSTGRDSESISVISPVGSWPAVTLLSHYEMVRDAKLSNQGTPPLKQDRDALDSISQTSSLYASIHRNPEKNSFMFNSMRYQRPEYRDIENYPFNPAYTSSLRRLHGQDNLASRLNTDV